MDSSPSSYSGRMRSSNEPDSSNTEDGLGHSRVEISSHRLPDDTTEDSERSGMLSIANNVNSDSTVPQAQEDQLELEAELEEVVDCTSQSSQNYPATNILFPHTGSWRTDSWVEKASITIKTKNEILPRGFKIVSDGAAFVEVYVSRTREYSPDIAKQRFRLLLSRSSLMTPLQSSPNKFETFRMKARQFDYELLHVKTREEKWDLFKFVCSQTFNKHVKFGLNSVHIITREQTIVENVKLAEPGQNNFAGFRLRQRDVTNGGGLRAGSFFAKRHRSPERDDSAHSSQEVGTSKRVAIDNGNLRRDTHDNLNSKPQQRDEHVSREGADTSRRTTTSVINLSRRLSEGDSNIEKDTHESIVCVVQPVNYDTSDISRGNDTTDQTTAGCSSSLLLSTRAKIYPQIRPYDKILDGVVFVLSGFVNPIRSELRDLAIRMGGTYAPNWNRSCTHLICAFKNTPKYKEVMSYNGRIMREHWVAECDKERKLLDWRKYKLGNYPYPDSEEEDE